MSNTAKHLLIFDRITIYNCLDRIITVCNTDGTDHTDRHPMEPVMQL